MNSRGYTLIELMVAIGLFAFVMTLTSGAYLMMISFDRRAQALASGVDNLSFALETMTRSIRTGHAYNCGGLGDCPSGAGSFSFTDVNGKNIVYAASTQSDGSATVGDIAANGVSITSPNVNVTGLAFIAAGTSNTDAIAPNVIIRVSGTVSAGPGRTEPFTIETMATMRGTDI